MTAAPRPSSAAARPAPSRRRRWAVRVAVALVLLAVVAWGGFTWLFYDPFEGRVPRLDRVIPASAGVALRGSAEELLASAFVRDRVLARTEFQDLFASWNLEENLRRLDQEQERLNARLPGFLSGVDFRGDFLGRETVLFGSLDPTGGGPVVARAVVATRLAPRARMLLSTLKHGFARRRVEESSGAKITRFPLVYEIDLAALGPDPLWTTCWGALVKDVLVLGNDRALVTEAVRLATVGGGGSLPYRADAGMAFSESSGAPLRAWADVARFGQDCSAAGRPSPGERAAMLEGLPGFLALLLDPAAVSTAQAVARFPSRDDVDLEIAGVRGETPPSGLPAALAEGRTRPASEALREAAVLAPAGSAVAAARVEAAAGALLKAFYGRTGPEVREEVEKALKDAKTSLDDLGREVDDYLEPGASAVVERLPECDSLGLDRYGADPDGRFVLPLPGVLLVLRQRASAGDGAAERFLRGRLEEWRARLETYEDLKDLPAGVRGFRFRPKFLTGEKDLVRPAAAFEGDLVLLATNEGTLRRALEAREGRRPSLSDFDGFEEAAGRCGEGQACAFVEGGALLKMLQDDRREAATRMVEKDWKAVRRKTMAEVARDFFGEKKEIRQQEVEDEVERRMEEAQRVQAEVEFPRAVETYLRGLKAGEELRFVAAGLSWDASGFRLLLSVRAGE